jgi:hypothetical protein
MGKKAQFICQHLEHISREMLERYRDVIRGYVRKRHGIYALYRKHKLYYVGLASSLQSRLKHHLKDRHADSWDTFSVYLTVEDSHLKELESLILRIAHPEGNKQKGKFAQSENLIKRILQDWRQRKQEEEKSLFNGFTIDDSEVLDRRIVRGPILAAYLSKIPKPRKLRAYHKGQKKKARIMRDGSVKFNDKLYTSPSVAGAAAVGRRTCNGWKFWKYQRSPGDWVKLDVLRK